MPGAILKLQYRSFSNNDQINKNTFQIRKRRLKRMIHQMRTFLKMTMGMMVSDIVNYIYGSLSKQAKSCEFIQCFGKQYCSCLFLIKIYKQCCVNPFTICPQNIGTFYIMLQINERLKGLQSYHLKTYPFAPYYQNILDAVRCHCQQRTCYMNPKKTGM